MTKNELLEELDNEDKIDEWRANIYLWILSLGDLFIIPSQKN